MYFRKNPNPKSLDDQITPWSPKKACKTKFKIRKRLECFPDLAGAIVDIEFFFI